MKYRRSLPVLHCLLIGLLLGQIFAMSFQPTSATAAPRSASASALTASPANGPALSVNRTGTTLVAPSGNVTLIATLQAGDGFTLTSLEASGNPAGPWQILGTYATPGPIVVTTGFNLTDPAFGGSAAPGPRTVTLRATDNAGNSSTVTLALTYDDQLDTFSDTANSPFVTAIRQLATRGIIRGYGDGRFGPGDTTLRAQMAALIARAMGWDLEDMVTTSSGTC